MRSFRPRDCNGDSESESSEYTPLLPQPDSSPVNWSETWTHARPYIIPATLGLRLLAIFSLLCEFLHRVTGLIPGYATKLIVDILSKVEHGQAIGFPFMPLTLFVGGYLLSNMFDSLHDVTYAVVESDASRRFSIDIYDHLLKLSLGFHLKRKTGEVASIMDRGIDSIDMIAHTVLFSVFPTLVEAAIVTVVFVRLGTPGIAVTIFLTVVGYFTFTIVATQWRNKYRREMNEVENKTNDMAIDTLMNYETVKTFGKERSEVAAFTKLENSYRGLFIWYRISLNVLNFGQEVLLNGGLGIVLVVAVWRAFSTGLSGGDVVLVLMYTGQVFGPLLSLGASYKALSDAATDLEKCIALLKTQATVTDAPHAITLPTPNSMGRYKGQGEIIFRNVWFTYGNHNEQAGGLRGISFHIKPGQVVAFVGASGTGKSTITRLLLRLYDVTSGEILVNGVNVQDVTQRSLRAQIGVVPQDTVLFNRTLRYNIGYGRDGACESEIRRAAEYARLNGLVGELEEGLDTVVGERGVRLSGGERQRVGIARCFVREPGIVVLDEASSALDMLTEREMQGKMREIWGGRTTVVIAHRLSTVMMADEIMVLGRGSGGSMDTEIVEQGSHKQLLRCGGLYARMWAAQNGTDAMEPLST